VEENARAAVLRATRDLLDAMLVDNGLTPEEVICAWFSVTPDLDVAFPAQAARGDGWSHVPLFCSQEPGVVGALERCIRVLLLCESELPKQAVRHVYTGRARALRPDLARAAAGRKAPVKSLCRACCRNAPVAEASVAAHDDVALGGVDEAAAAAHAAPGSAGGNVGDGSVGAGGGGR